MAVFRRGVSKRAFLYLNEKKNVGLFCFCKICFVRQCAPLTMNYELLIAMCDRINHLKNWFVQLKNKSECIWKLLGDVLGGLKSVPEPFWSLLRPPWERLGRLLGALGWVLGASKSILGACWSLLGDLKCEQDSRVRSNSKS